MKFKLIQLTTIPIIAMICGVICGLITFYMPLLIAKIIFAGIIGFISMITSSILFGSIRLKLPW